MRGSRGWGNASSYADTSSNRSSNRDDVSGVHVIMMLGVHGALTSVPNWNTPSPLTLPCPYDIIVSRGSFFV